MDFDGRGVVSTGTATAEEAEFPTLRPERVPELRRPEPPREDPRRGRDFRQVTGTPPELLLGEPPRPELLDPYQPRRLGGYYYGLIRGEDGRLIYGKVYIPFYGPFQGEFHNDPPPLRLRLRRPPPRKSREK